MKKLFPHIHLLTLFLACAGAMLRLIFLLMGTDDRGLYPAGHPLFWAVCLLTLATVAFLGYMSRMTDRKRWYRGSYPVSLPGCLGCLAAAAGIACTNISLIRSADRIEMLTGLLGLACAVMLVLWGFDRQAGKKPAPYIGAIPCLFFALRVFYLGKTMGTDPEMVRYIFEFLGALALLPASYYLWGFHINLGNRNKSVFWSLTALYLCICAAPGSSQWPLNLGCALWLLTNLCSLRPLLPLYPMDPFFLPQEDLWGTPTE